MTLACGTTRGSAVIMPPTSVQISTALAPRATPKIDALQSEPPLPSVVVSPCGVAPMNPPATGISPRAQAGRRRSRARLSVSASSGRARPK